MWKRISFVTAREKSTVTNEMASPRKGTNVTTIPSPSSSCSLTASHRVKESQKLAVSEDETSWQERLVLKVVPAGKELGSLPHMLSFSVL